MPAVSGKKPRCIRAIDLGTSGAKSALVTTSGRVLGCEIEKFPLRLLPEGGAEQDPEDWWKAVVTSSRKILNRRLVPAEDIVAVSCTAQWSDTVPVGTKGKHLRNAIIWMDSRGSGYIEDITGGFLRIAGHGIGKLPKFIRLTGGIPAHSGKDSLAHILYIKHAHPDIYDRTYKFLEPKDYINLRLTGYFMSSFDTITLHWVTDNRDIARVAYDDRLIRISTLDREKLPELGRAVDILGTLQEGVADELGLEKRVKVLIGAPDMHTAALGSGAVRDFEAHLSIGSSSWLTCHLPAKKTDLFHNMASLPSAIPGRYFLTDAEIYRRFEKTVARVPAGSDGVLFTPWLYGERTPVENHLLRATYCNLSLCHNRAHLLRAVYEGVAFNTRWLLKYVEKFTRRKLPSIRMIGGGAVSRAWCQIHADVCDRIMEQVEDPLMSNLRGAAFIASVSLGFINFEDIPRCVRISRVFEPQGKTRDLYDRLFEEYLALYRKTKRICARLNKSLTRTAHGGSS